MPISHCSTTSTSQVQKILLVEDQSIIALATSARLSREGYEVSVARSGEHAIELVSEAAASGGPYRLVLMDIDLGAGIDGVESARRIIDRHEVPIVFLTAHTEPEYVERVRQVTRYGYVLKTSGDLVLRLTMEMAVDLFEANLLSRRQKRELEAIYENAPIIMFVVDDEARIVKLNRRARDRVGSADGRAPALGQVVNCLRAISDPAACGLFPECTKCGLRAIVAQTIEDGTEYHDVPVTVDVPAPDGHSSRTVSVSTSPIERDGERRTLVSIVDLDSSPGNRHDGET